MSEGSPAECVSEAIEEPGKVCEDVRTSPHAELGYVFHSFINHCTVLQVFISLRPRTAPSANEGEMGGKGGEGGGAGCKLYKPLALSDTRLPSELEPRFDIRGQSFIALLMRNGLQKSLMQIQYAAVTLRHDMT